jgi:hypothetical protein
MVTGVPTQILDFSQGTMPMVRNIGNSDVIITCVLTIGTKWICVTGQGEYIRFDMKIEATILTFKKEINNLMAEVSNNNCAYTKDDTELICARLQQNYM